MLAEPASYFPLEKGIYEVAPGLRPFGADLGNGQADAHVFQIDSEFEKYRANRLSARAERLAKYLLTHEFDAPAERAVTRFLIERLTRDHPAHFRFEGDFEQGGSLECTLTGETLVFDPALALVEMRGAPPVEPPYVSAFDALCSQVQEDVAVMRAEPGRDWVAALHLCSPSHWAGADKIGKNFFAVHQPVAEVEKMNRSAGALVEAMIRKGPYVRFVWGFGTDDRLNHHPEPAPGEDADRWHGRTFDRVAATPFFLRYERQGIHGLPEVNASVFTIRVYFTDGNAIKADPRKRALLRSSLVSMSPASRAYKGIERDIDAVVAWLDS